MDVQKGVYQMQRGLMSSRNSLLYDSCTNLTNQTVIQLPSTIRYVAYLQALFLAIPIAIKQLEVLVDQKKHQEGMNLIEEHLTLTKSWLQQEGYQQLHSFLHPSRWQTKSADDMQLLVEIAFYHLRITERTFCRIHPKSDLDDLEIVLNHLRELPFDLEEDLQIDRIHIQDEIRNAYRPEPIMVSQMALSLPNYEKPQKEEHEDEPDESI
ncbi:hypothetical protein J2Z48_000194 [Croceifilum oryzae]|uniref:Uncharacterized protein n=1 Tax=Croceifilum oryzae TaxID=1553429 RepID=A0AAJ1WSK0_9BACL|nr:hypothetical protein [Croceifilum oryzae]MDQ0416036.1 hypothetical protein [Croceifilum oryzae]